MIIKLMGETDLDQLRKIHQEFYETEFVFPFDGPNKLLDKYVIENDDGEIIIFGALEVVVEGIVITNKGIDIKERREAFYKLLQCLQFSAKNNNFDTFHLSAQDKKWANHLIKKFGFKPCRGEFLYTEV